MSGLLHSYYLHQMGIERWVIRTAPTVASNIKLLILAEIPEEDRRFLKKMLESIAISEEEATIVSAVHEQTIVSSIQVSRPRALWVMGADARQLLSLKTTQGCVHDYHGRPLVVSEHPSELRRMPIKKKQAYHDLLLLAQALR